MGDEPAVGVEDGRGIEAAAAVAAAAAAAAVVVVVVAAAAAAAVVAAAAALPWRRTLAPASLDLQTLVEKARINS